MGKILLGIMIAFFLVSMVAAEQQTMGPFKQHDCVELIQTCSNCTYVNISSVVLPNSTKIFRDIGMTAEGSDFNATFCTTDSFGRYVVNTVQDVDGYNTVAPYDFYVNPSGNIQDSIWNNSVLLIFIPLALILLVLGIGFNLPPLGFLSGMVFMLVGVYTMIYGFNNLTDLYTQSIAGVLLGIGFIISIIAAWESISK